MDLRSRELRAESIPVAVYPAITGSDASARTGHVSWRNVAIGQSNAHPPPTVTAVLDGQHRAAKVGVANGLQEDGGGRSSDSRDQAIATSRRNLAHRSHRASALAAVADQPLWEVGRSRLILHVLLATMKSARTSRAVFDTEVVDRTDLLDDPADVLSGSPGEKHICPNIAACWSPSAQVRGVPPYGKVEQVGPYPQLLTNESPERSSPPDLHRMPLVRTSPLTDPISASVTSFGPAKLCPPYDGNHLTTRAWALRSSRPHVHRAANATRSALKGASRPLE